MTFVLTGFADEISPDLAEQLDLLAAESIGYLEFRGAWSTNVADLTDAQVTAFRSALDRAGVGVSAIGLPIGKIGINDPFEPELARMLRIAEIASQLGANLVRVFYFMLDGDPPERYRLKVIDRLAALTQIAVDHGLVLAHENEKLIYGDTPERCADIITSVESPNLRATFDAANFVQRGYRPHTDGYQLLRRDPQIRPDQRRPGQDRRGGPGRSRRRRGPRNPQRPH